MSKLAKFYRGKIIPTIFGGVQFVRNRDANKDMLLVTSRIGDIYIPVERIEKALEAQWDADSEERHARYERIKNEKLL